MIVLRPSRALALLVALALLTGVAAVAAAPACTNAPARPHPGPEGLHVIVLDNGPTVVLQRIPGATCVAIEEVHPVGLIHDPAGITQGTHLVEHLRCMGATATFASGESFAQLAALGMCNAETMGDMTHYDIVVPREQLGLALQIIAERCGSLAPDAALIAQEAPRCHAEVDGVLHALRSPGFKFSLAAAVQSWRHGRTDASLRGGLDAWSPADVGAFISATHSRTGMTLAIAGDLDAAEVEAAARQHFEALLGATAPRGGDAPDLGRPIAYEDLPADASIKWDVDTSAVFVLYPPPTDPDERLALTLWCAGAQAQLAARFGGAAGGLMLNAHTYPVGELPALAFLPVTPGADAGDTGRRLAESLEAMAAAPGASVAGARSMGAALAMNLEQMCGPAGYEQGVRALAARMGQEQAERYALANVALQLGMTSHALGPDPAARLEGLRARDAAWWEGVVRRAINPAQRRITRLVPGAD